MGQQAGKEDGLSPSPTADTDTNRANSVTKWNQVSVRCAKQLQTYTCTPPGGRKKKRHKMCRSLSEDDARIRDTPPPSPGLLAKNILNVLITTTDIDRENRSNGCVQSRDSQSERENIPHDVIPHNRSSENDVTAENNKNNAQETHKSAATCSDGLSSQHQSATADQDARLKENQKNEDKDNTEDNKENQNNPTKKEGFVQLSGHEGAFAQGAKNTILKLQTKDGDTEARVYERLMGDVCREVVPGYHGEVFRDDKYYIELENLLTHFVGDVAVMDVKIGNRTFAEKEAINPKLRPDLYQKMVKVNPEAATKEEQQKQAITKVRYMTFREKESSTSAFSFRVEASKVPGGKTNKDLKTVRTWEQVLKTLGKFFKGHPAARDKTVERLQVIREKFTASDFFKRHEIVGSSILMLYDVEDNAGAWMIDFAKTAALPDDISVSHAVPWELGNHEDGYLTGLDNLIKVAVFVY
ncbi:PREDICTED: inositol-trisphosphate 3-kinase A-like [Branchiostoma belcheri]|uniref:Kinase n=1 Tax=Branchiostoma belcheri TaxID=7741 RepID=A0A6P4ZM50_BRABE|nr:PREDICTED: inositol-trisphosphate 3-kinase A-like [Branchiostoma belcheri]